jgi:hypothetical protein
MKGIAWITVGCVAMAWLCVPAHAALTAGQKMAAETLIKQFSAPEFAARQAAVEKVIALGPDVLPLIRKTLAETADAEVKLRCQMVLKALGASAVPAPPAEKFGCGPSKINLDVKDAPLAEVVEKLAEQSGNARIDVGEALGDKPVTLAAKDVTYWEAVDALCDRLGLMYAAVWRGVPAAGGKDGMIQLVEAEKDAKLRGLAGPVVVRLDSCTKTVQYIIAKMPVPKAWPVGVANFMFNYFWEDRLDPLSTEVEVRTVLTSDGRNVTPQAAPGRGMMGRPFAMGVKTPPCSAFTLNVPNLPDDVRKLAEISGVVHLEFGTGEKEARIDDVLNAVGKEMKFDDWAVTVTKADKTKWGLQVQVEAKFKGEQTPMPAWWAAGGYGWWVQEGDGGKKTRGWAGGGTWAVPGVGQGERAWGVAPARKGEHTVMFQGQYEGGIYSLILLLPAVHETKEFPFTIKDVPLP